MRCIRKLLLLYLTPIVFLVWAGIIEFTNEEHQVAKLVTLAISIAIQINALIRKYKESE